MTAKPRPRALVPVGHGINCDDETYWALEKAGAIAQKVHINDLFERKYQLKDYQIIVFPGGFSFGDDIGAGQVIAKLSQIKLGDDISEFVTRDKLVLGFCNGFQIMVKMGILPGFDGDYRTQRVTLAQNDSNQYEDRWVHLIKAPENNDKCVATKGINGLYLPVAHGEGKFYAEQGMIERLNKEGLVVFRYATPLNERAHGVYPENPNGALEDIAGICDPTGRVFGMMPHPERCLQETNHPLWTMHKEIDKRGGHSVQEVPDGMKIFKNVVNYFK